MSTDNTTKLLQEKIKLLEAKSTKLKSEISHYQIVFDNCPMMIWFKDKNNNILKVNKLVAEAAKSTPEAMQNRHTRDFYPEEADSYYKDDLEVIKSGLPKLGIIETLQTSKGKISVQTDKVPWRDESGDIQGVIVIVSDITERKRFEEEIYKSQKLKSLGILAGGLAHDLNNLLGGITGNIDLACLSLIEGDDCSVYLNRIKAVLDRAKNLTHQLLTFSQGGAPIRSTISLEKLISECIDLFSAGSNVECRLTVKDKLLNVYIDSGQISQVMNNLILNAQQAMPEGGVVNIELKNVQPGSSELSNVIDNKQPYVRISVQDHGQGIPDEVADNIFDPFFSTKETGTGLGLSISHSIIKRHGGFITFNSNEAGGTTFHVYIPSTDKPLASTATSKHNYEAIKARVLVMDDDAFIIDSMSNMLRIIGCEFDCARNGTDAIKLFNQAIENEKPYDIVILDLTIHGGLGGKETIGQLRQTGKAFKSIVSSGYSNDPVMSSPFKYGFDAVLRKPFGMDELRKILKDLIFSNSA